MALIPVLFGEIFEFGDMGGKYCISVEITDTRRSYGMASKGERIVIDLPNGNDITAKDIGREIRFCAFPTGEAWEMEGFSFLTANTEQKIEPSNEVR